MPTKEDFGELSPADFTDQVENASWRKDPYESLRVQQEKRRRRTERWTRSILFVLAITAFIALVMVWSCAPASAQAPCAPHDEMMRQLESRYQEHVVATGVTPDSNIMEITASESGSWSIVVSNPRTGLSCLFAAGEKWHVEPQEPGRPT